MALGISFPSPSLNQETNRQYDKGFYYNQLNETEKENYDKILIGCQNFEERISINDISLDSFYKVQTAFNYDNPQFFWTLSYTISINTKTETPVYVNFKISEEDRDTFQRLNDLGEGIIRDMPEEFNDYQKIKYLYGYIVNNTTYDLSSANNQDIRSVFIGGSSICAGYSRAFKFLCDKAGIPCAFIAGEANGGRHSWNLVNLEGCDYWIDPTYGETIYTNGTESCKIKYDYFLVSDKTLLETHILTGDIETTRKYIEKAFTYPDCKEDYSIKYMLKILKRLGTSWFFCGYLQQLY